MSNPDDPLRPLVPVLVVATSVERAEQMVARAIDSGLRIDAWAMYRPEKAMTTERPRVLACDTEDLEEQTRDLLKARGARIAWVSCPRERLSQWPRER